MSRKKNKDNDIIVSFVGGSLTDVTGSSVLISYPLGNNERKCICLECGMIQGSMNPEVQYSVNKKLVENIPVEGISNVFIGHPHVDHTGNLSIFGNEKFEGNIIMCKDTYEITKDLLIDSEYLHSKEIEYLRSKGRKPKPLHTEVMLYAMFNKVKAVDSGVDYKLDDYCSYRFYNSGHVVGGYQIKFTFTNPQTHRNSTLVYTSDLGSNYNLKYKPFVKEKDIIQKADMYIFEGTYGVGQRCFDKTKVESERAEMKKAIERRLKNGNRVFIPSFSFGRTQELMHLIYYWFKDEEWFREIPVVIDGKLTNTICNTYSRILKDEDLREWETIKNWNNFVYNKDYKGTLAWLSKREKGIYISSSGFIQPQTRSSDYVKNFMGCKNDLIIFVGYAGGEGSLANELINKPKGTPIKFDNTTLIKSCDVIAYTTFSSHIQQDEIFDYWSKINAGKILIHHASEESKKELKEKGEEYLRSKNKTTRIVAVGTCASQFILNK